MFGLKKGGGYKLKRPKFDKEKCEGCGSCTLVCPQNCISPVTAPGIGVEIDFDLCEGCGKCVENCEWGAFTEQENE